MPIKTLIISLLTNIGLTLLKLGGGIITGSSGLVADGFHSLTDSISIIINYFGMKMSLKPANGLKAYENYKKEIRSTIIISFILFLIGLYLVISNYMNLTLGVSHSPGLVAGLIIIIAFIITVILYDYSKNNSEKFNTPALAINKEQIRLNILSTIAVFIGIAGSLVDMHFLDSLAAVLVGLIVLYSAIDVLLKLQKDVEAAKLTEKQINAIKAVVLESGGNKRIIKIRTMPIRNKLWLLLILSDANGAQVDMTFRKKLKTDLLSELLFLDNVIIDTATSGHYVRENIETEDFGSELLTTKNFASMGLTLFLTLMIGFAAFGMKLSTPELTVLVPADSPDQMGDVSMTLGRAKYFYIYRTDRNKGRFIKNYLAGNPGRIEHQIVRLFKDYCIESVITENVGSYIFSHLTDSGINLSRSKHRVSIKNTIELFKQGELNKINRPNVGIQFGYKNYNLIKPWYNWQNKK